MQEPEQQSLVCAHDPDSGTQQSPFWQIPCPQQFAAELHGSTGTHAGGGGWQIPFTHDSPQQSIGPRQALPSGAHESWQRPPAQMPEQQDASL